MLKSKQKTNNKKKGGKKGGQNSELFLGAFWSSTFGARPERVRNVAVKMTGIYIAPYWYLYCASTGSKIEPVWSGK